MRILQVSSYYPPHIGGQENCVKNISTVLAEKGHQVEVYTSSIGHAAKNVTYYNNLIVKYLKSIEFAHTPIIFSLFINLLQADKKSIIHLHVAQAFTPEIVYIVSLLRQIPYIAHVHADVQSSGKYGFLLPFYKNNLLKIILHRANKIIVPTADYITIIANRYNLDTNKFVVIPSGVDFEKFKNSKEKLHNPIKILFVGRLSRQKNVPLLIEAFKEIYLSHKDTELLIVGDGEDKEKILELIKKEKLSHNIKLIGAIHGEKLYDLFKNSDIFISTSIYESFGIAIIEAMASGLSIIAPNINAIKNVVINNRNGILVEPTAKNYKDAFNKIVKNVKFRKTLRENALRDVQQYSWTKIVSRLERVYQELG